MPSPIAHLTAGCVVYVIAQPRQPEPDPHPDPSRSRTGRLPFLLLVTTGFSLLPDLDSFLGLAAGDFGRFHNNLTHSLLVGAAIALAFGGLMQRRRGSGFWFWFVIALVSYELHVLMDWATVGRGVMAWWPLSMERYQAPALVFYGLHWSQGWWSVRHLWTVATELAFAAMTAMLLLPVIAARRAKEGA